MPNPDQQNSTFRESNISRIFEQQKAAPVDDLAELRKDIAEIKQLLKPSIILTGQSVIDEYQKLNK